MGQQGLPTDRLLGRNDGPMLEGTEGRNHPPAGPQHGSVLIRTGWLFCALVVPAARSVTARSERRWPLTARAEPVGPWRTVRASSHGWTGQQSTGNHGIHYGQSAGFPLTGFNHYPDCACGWCVNYSRMSHTTRVRLVADLRHRDALTLLKSNSARTVSGCYVNPNAKCPVCGDAVYFYANEHGSRVFFDELGPPWPKHPCTDNPHEPVSLRGAPTRRTRGMMQELITAANVAGLFKNKTFGRRIPEEWTLLVVVTVGRVGAENTVTAEFLNSLNSETTQFKFRSAEPVLDPGDFVNMKGSEISFVHKATMVPVTFVDGAMIMIPKKAAEPRPPLLLPPAIPPKAKHKLAFPKMDRAADYSREPMTEAEMVHFNSHSVGLGQLFAKLEPVVKAYARDQLASRSTSRVG